MTQTYASTPSRNQIDTVMEMLSHAEPIKCLSPFATQHQQPQRKTDTAVFRRVLPIDAAANGAPVVEASNYLMQEGTTPTAGGIDFQDVQVTLSRYGILLKVTDKAALMYEDDIPAAMKMAVGEHMGTVEEMISYGVVRGGSNVVYSNGTSRSAVNTGLTLPKIRQVGRVLQAAHAKMLTSRLSSSPNFGTTAVSPCYLAFGHTNLGSQIRDLPGFKDVADYGQQQKVHDREIGCVDDFRFVLSPTYRPWLQAGGTVAASTFLSNNADAGGAADVYPLIFIAKDAWGEVALKGYGSAKADYLPPSTISHANPMQTHGYVSASFYKAAVRLNENFMVRLETCATVL